MGTSSLPYGLIHLWFVFPDEISDAHLLAAYEDLLTGEEKKRRQRYRFAKHRHQFLVTRALLRTTLSRYTDIDPRKWRFTLNRYGKPEIDNDTGDLHIRFNLSHTDGLILCGIVRKDDIGVDVENCRRNNNTIEIAQRYFSKQEFDDLRNLPRRDQRNRFFTYWTLKESYIKANGMGLSMPLDQFTFHVAPDHPLRISFDPRLDDNPEQWYFRRFKPSRKHLAAVAVRSSQKRAFHLVVHRSIPLVRDDSFSCEIVAGPRNPV